MFINRNAPRLLTSTLGLALALSTTACSDAGADSAPDADQARSRSRPQHSAHLDRPAAPPQDPAVANLDPLLQAAVEEAARDARTDGVAFTVTSGWRSRAHQARLFAEAVEEYGSVDEARRYVATPDTSAHVTGDAVDIGPTEADSWLSQHGADYGLCQTFANEIWHYELAITPGDVCPASLPDGSSR